MTRFDLHPFLVDVFDPQPGETVAVLVDEPRSPKDDRPSWVERRAMASAWRDGIEALGGRIGFTTLLLVAYPATMANGADLPERCRVGDREAPLAEVLDGTSLVLAMTEFSPTAALVDVCKRRPGADVFRAASMPGVEPRMEETSLAADYAEVARRCRLLRDAFRRSSGAEVVFSTGHRCFFDLRHRTCETDDGYLHRDKNDDIPVINLPSGETFVVPYEGEKSGDPSGTEGELPVAEGAEVVVFQVKANRIVAVRGDGPAAASYRAFFEADPARANIAELAFGCNERAVVTGTVLEDEKAGFHWAYGRSDHLGGVTGLAAFKSPDTQENSSTGAFYDDNLIMGTRVANDGVDPAYFDGFIDEVRISTVARDTCWIGTSYNNMNSSSPGTYYSVEGEEELVFNHRKQISILNSMTPASCSSNLTNYPVHLSLSGNWLKTAPTGDIHSANGYDIIFRAQDGVTKLDHEIEDYNGSLGTLVAWVRIPTLLYNANTIIYMYYGNSTINTSQANPTGVWNEGGSNNYKAVWHLKESGNGTAGEFKDSTSNNNHGQGGGGTPGYVPVLWAGTKIIDGAQDFDGADDYVDVGSGSSIDDIFVSGGTVSTWIYPQGWGESNYGRIAVKASDVSSNSGWGLLLVNDANCPSGCLQFAKGFTTTEGYWNTPNSSQ